MSEEKRKEYMWLWVSKYDRFNNAQYSLMMRVQAQKTTFPTTNASRCRYDNRPRTLIVGSTSS